jgi:alpha-glucuronidase
LRRCVFFLAIALHAETGREAWLRYSRENPEAIPAVLATLGDSPVIVNARDEILRGIRGMAGKTLRLESAMPRENAIFPRISRTTPTG